MTPDSCCILYRGCIFFEPTITWFLLVSYTPVKFFLTAGYVIALGDGLNS